MNVGQDGDPYNCVRFGYLRGLNGGKPDLLLTRPVDSNPVQFQAFTVTFIAAGDPRTVANCGIPTQLVQAVWFLMVDFIIEATAHCSKLQHTTGQGESPPYLFGRAPQNVQLMCNLYIFSLLTGFCSTTSAVSLTALFNLYLGCVYLFVQHSTTVILHFLL